VGVDRYTTDRVLDDLEVAEAIEHLERRLGDLGAYAVARESDYARAHAGVSPGMRVR
jgi:hypothetical protein